MALALLLALVSVVILIEQTGLVHLVLVQVSANGIENASRNWKAQAINNEGLVLVFRPRGGPYQTIYVNPPDKGSVLDTIPLQRGVYLVNTNGLIDNDELRFNDEGKLADSVRPQPVMTVASPYSRQIAQLSHDGTVFVRR